MYRMKNDTESMTIINVSVPYATKKIIILCYVQKKKNQNAEGKILCGKLRKKSEFKKRSFFFKEGILFSIFIL